MNRHGVTTTNMPGSSSRLWVLTATHRSLVRDSINSFRDKLLSTSPSLSQVSSHANSPSLSTTPSSTYRETWRSWQITSCSPKLLSKSNLELSFCNSSPATARHLFFGRQFASSLFYVAKAEGSYASRPGKSSGLKSRSGAAGSAQPRRTLGGALSSIRDSRTDDGRGKPGFSRKNNGASSGRLVSSKRGRPILLRSPVKARRPFRGALSSIKDLETENGRGNSDPVSVRRILGKKNLQSKSSGRAIRSSNRMKSVVSSRYKFKDRPADEGLKILRKRKRIKPRPKDITYKRALDSDAVIKAIDMGQELSVPEKACSLGSQFRQIQPSRELIAHIEENFLGRRRLTEWRKGGYDPKRTAPLDDSPDDAERKNPILESIFKKKPMFIAAAKRAPSLPHHQYPEVAFAGRSNVGKSSLVNALTRRWGSARTSDKPGLTQSINFFKLGEHLCLVDLPGYGFAYAKEDLKEVWEELVKDYVQTRFNLKRVCLLVDAKWGLKPRDEELIHLMESASRRYQIVVTKTDILPPLELARRATQILKALEDHKFLIRPLVMVSSKTGAGLQLLRASLAQIARKESRAPQKSEPMLGQQLCS